MFNLTIDNNRIGVYFYSDKIADIELLDDTIQDIQLNDNLSSIFFDQKTISVFNNKTYIEIVLMLTDHSTSSRIAFPESIIRKMKQGYRVQSGEKYLYISAVDGSVTKDKNILTLSPDNLEMRLVIGNEDFPETAVVSVQSEQNDVSMMAVDDYLYKVTTDQRIPEFYIELFDDASYTIPRDMFNGIPVLSTIPTTGNVTTPSTYDDYAYKLGIGEKSRKVYIKVTSDASLRPLNFESYMRMPVPKIKIIRAISEEATVLYSADLSFISGNSYGTNFDIDPSWGDHELLLFQVYFDMQIERSLPVKLSVGLPAYTPAVNIFSME